MKRFGALILAVGMIFGSLMLRNSLDTKSQTSNASGGSNSVDPDKAFRLTCASDLEVVCKGLEGANPALTVTIEQAGITADRLTALADGGDPGFDAWLTVGPWAEIVQDNRSFTANAGEVLETPSAVLASSSADIVTLKTDEQALTDSCGGAITWKCLGENQSLPQPQSIGMPSPNTGAGLAVLADATNSYFSADDYSAADFEDPAFISWFSQLTKNPQNSQLGAQTVLVRALTAAGTYTTVGALSSEVASLPTSSRRFGVISPPKDAPSQPVIAQVRLVPAQGIDTKSAVNQIDQEALTKLLEGSGWNTSSPDQASNMPEPGVLQVLREMWAA